MGTMLRNALRSVCVDGGWSYAVFWRIVVCGDSRRLIWEEGHHEPSRTSSLFKVPGFEAAYSLLEEWGVLQENCDDGADGNKFQPENRVGLLLEKIMKPKVHLLGCGIIGCAALTGNHQWILQNELRTEGYTSQDLEEMKDQFSAGVQTVAVIPVLPYGVIQLGSVQMITQTMGFISHVRSLFLQLGLVTGALFSDSNIRTSLHQKVQSHILPELTVSAEVSEKTGAKISMGSTSDSCSYQVSKAPASSPLNQLHCSLVSEIYEKGAPTFADSHLNSKPIFKSINGSLNEILQPRAPAAVKSTSSLSVKQEGQSAATFGFSNADEIPYQHANFNNSKSEGQSQPSMVSSEFDSTDFIFLKQQLLPSFGAQESGNSKQTLGGAMTSHTGSQMHPDSRYSRGSTTTSLLSRSESSLNANSIETGNFGLFPSSTGTKNTVNIRNLSSSLMTGYGMFNNSSFSDNHLSSMEVTSVNTENINIGFPSASKSDKWKMKNGSSQALAYPTSSSNSCVSRTYSSHESLHESFLRNNNHGQGSQNFQVNPSDRINTLITDQGKEINSKDVHIPVHTVSKESSCLSFMRSSGNDLYDALGLDVKPRQSTGKLDALFASMVETNAWDLNTDVYSSRKLDADPVLDASHFGISCSENFSDLGHDQLLDAVVSKVNANAIQCSDDNVSCKTTLTNISQTVVGNIPSHGCCLDSSGKMLPCASPALGIENAGSLPAGSCSLDKAGDSSLREEAYKSQISLWVENNQSLKNDSTSSSNCKRIDETGKLHRKRPRPGETPRPRPKDRQMIQDRVKELREIVPNGAKCSIDALLERTIKHMLFLQSVTKHADKLKETGAPKIINKGGLLLKDNVEGGATWAFEIGSQSMIFPIIVEDLNPPRQLLVEMLCEDRGFFLEIADLIKGLGLTILKGVMEVRNDKVWARFAVEANSDVTRMDIFLSLVRLLEPTAATNVGPPQGLEDTTMAHNMLCQSSIPATGVANHLQ